MRAVTAGPWWRANHYSWLSGYLAARGMSRAVRAAMIVLSASFVGCLILLLISGDGPQGTLAVAMTWAAVIGGLSAVALFAWRWPTRGQSLAFVVVVNASIAAACLAHPNPLAALIGCIAFATSGAYAATFHSTAWMLYNFAVAAVVTTVQATKLALAGHHALAVVDWWLVIEVNISLPLGGQILVRALAKDLLRADTDPLTSLLNRRSFNRKALGMIHTRARSADHLLVMLIDLDNFKTLNDTHGHDAGDQALVRTAHTLTATAGPGAVIARSGGEEFLLAATVATCATDSLADHLCAAIAADPAGVTASIGVACTRLTDTSPTDHETVLRGLITAADAAMYTAKRNGGNQIHRLQTPTPQQPPTGHGDQD
ncbi:GGDEF domain-containing protein [Mycolicibacterium palauense]|uniref:GGDEF domain-containing protein n=1 Tax=Mycolicibacterium palauense TaxID=2034511 RepID=UPI001FE4D5AB|nr:GGDEF domain-containing protein [Mycolicibacterium palauense]